MKLIRWKWLIQFRRLGRGVQCHPGYASSPAMTGMSGMSGICLTKPAAPTSPAIASTAFSSWTVSAAVAAGATTYNLYRAIHGNTLALYQAGLASPSYEDSPSFSSSNTAYDYAWTAVNSAGESPKSSTVVLTAVWLDNFTGTNGTALASHAPDIGATYTDVAAGLTIQSNACQNGSASSNRVSVQASGQSNCSIQGVFTWLSSSTEYSALLVRTDNADASDLQLGVDPGNLFSLGQVILIRENNGGVNTIRASVPFTFATSTPYNVYAKINGASATVAIGATTVSYNSVSASGTGLGLRIRSQSVGAWDSVLATDKP